MKRLICSSIFFFILAFNHIQAGSVEFYYKDNIEEEIYTDISVNVNEGTGYTTTYELDIGNVGLHKNITTQECDRGNIG